MNFQSIANECEDDLRAGRIGHAANRLRPILLPDIPRDLACAFAGLFRRAHLETFALRLLTPLDHRSPSETIEYATSLHALGVTQEAVDLLNSLDHSQFPEAKSLLADFAKESGQILPENIEPSYRVGPPDSPSFILLTGQFENFTAEAPSKMVHQLLAILLRHSEKPRSIGALFSELFLAELFDIFSSPNRVHQLLWRLRKWTNANSIPLELNEASGNYSVKITGNFSFIVPREKMTVDENVLHLRQLQSRFAGQPSFTPREAQECLNISSSSFKRLAQWALREEKLRREGASRATIYKLVA